MPKIRSRTAPLQRPDDSPEMRDAISELQLRGIRLIRPTVFQLKIGDINFYPGTGTIQFDGGKALEASGLPALLRIIDQRFPQIHKNHLSLEQVIPRNSR